FFEVRVSELLAISCRTDQNKATPCGSFYFGLFDSCEKLQKLREESKTNLRNKGIKKQKASKAETAIFRSSRQRTSGDLLSDRPSKRTPSRSPFTYKSVELC
ncbi:MAG: hypothetical protein LUH03_07190, partial [Oscillospiraceae bacterium]|nr:hypothetical protein [Oscillospiraceae bacterium]